MHLRADPFFTIITPVYNRPDCIIRCLESISGQAYNSYEVIVINDGSTDDTLQKIKSIASKFTIFKLINYPENRGVNFARNRGIERAQGKFIIFLDSDDTLTIDALVTIEKSINQYPNFFHYLFKISDRIDDKNIPDEIYEYQFKDWLSGKASGDYVNVIQPSCFNGLMFVEEFRIYESLNWLRVLRQNQKQLFIPSVVIQVERDRPDSVTREYILDNKISMQNTYNFLYKFIDWYHTDFKTLGLLNSLRSHIKKGFFLGVALGETARNEYLIKQLESTTFERKLYKFMNNHVFSPIFYRLIIAKSQYNKIKKKNYENQPSYLLL